MTALQLRSVSATCNRPEGAAQPLLRLGAGTRTLQTDAFGKIASFVLLRNILDQPQTSEWYVRRVIIGDLLGQKRYEVFHIGRRSVVAVQPPQEGLHRCHTFSHRFGRHIVSP